MWLWSGLWSDRWSGIRHTTTPTTSAKRNTFHPYRQVCHSEAVRSMICGAKPFLLGWIQKIFICHDTDRSRIGLMWSRKAHSTTCITFIKRNLFIKVIFVICHDKGFVYLRFGGVQFCSLRLRIIISCFKSLFSSTKDWSSNAILSGARSNLL